MSYCRFRNTSGDLFDCLQALDYEEGVSPEEGRAGKSMFREFLDFCTDRGIIDEYRMKNVESLFGQLTEDDDD